MILELRGLTKYFGGLVAVNNLDLNVAQGEILGLIGPNGAGKTTTFNLISGFYHPTSGTVIFDGRDVTHFKPEQVARRGLVRTFQPNTLFRNKTVFDNVLIAQHLQRRAGFFSLIFNTSSARSEESESQKQAMEILKFMDLAEVKGELARNLPHGFQRTLGIAMALSANPKLMLLDEPVTGVNREEATAMLSRIQSIREQGITILLVEHDMKIVMSLCTRIVVLNFGRKIAEGLPEEIRENKDVIESYLGSEESK